MVKGKFNFKELERYQKKIEKISKEEKVIQKFCRVCANEIATRLLSLVIPRTPVSKNITYIDADGKKRVMKNGGTLRRGWIARTEKEAESGSRIDIETPEIQKYVDSLVITKERKCIYY